MRHNNGNWAGYTYEWNAQETEATRVVGGKSATGGGPDLAVPERRSMPAVSHAGRGPLARTGDWHAQWRLRLPAPGRTANQLTTLEHHRHADAGAHAAAGPTAGDPGSAGQCAARRSVRAPIYMRIAATAIGRAARTPTQSGPALHHGAERDQCLRCRADPRRSRHHQSAADRAGFGRTFGGGGAHESHRSGCHAAAGKACQSIRRECS